jgi:hypothetical protein
MYSLSNMDFYICYGPCKNLQWRSNGSENIDACWSDGILTLQGKSHLCIPFLGIARPWSQFPHSYVCERFIYSQDRSSYFPAAE